ncbi:MAG TPA: hypothetical protein VH268_06355 [Solirubrobacterales bacterium]|nr:hypothetical protein [Solirubrobacterales bacterium]
MQKMPGLLIPILAGASAVVTIIAFALSHVTETELLVFLGALGTIWFVAIFILVGRYLITNLRTSGSFWSAAFSVLLLVLVVYIGAEALFRGSVSGLDFDSFSWLQLNGLVGIAFGLIIGFVELRYRYAAQFKRCPDCDEDVRKAAKVCKFCAFRWPAEGAAEAEVSAAV